MKKALWYSYIEDSKDLRVIQVGQLPVLQHGDAITALYILIEGRAGNRPRFSGFVISASGLLMNSETWYRGLL
jgi:hypothetical protein